MEENNYKQLPARYTILRYILFSVHQISYKCYRKGTFTNTRKISCGWDFSQFKILTSSIPKKSRERKRLKIVLCQSVVFSTWGIQTIYHVVSWLLVTMQFPFVYTSETLTGEKLHQISKIQLKWRKIYSSFQKGL